MTEIYIYLERENRHSSSKPKTYCIFHFRYTYGKPVKGSLSVSAVIKRPYFYGQSKRPEDLPMHLVCLTFSFCNEIYGWI